MSKLSHIEAGLKCLTLARVDNDPHRRIGVEILPCRLQLTKHVRIQGIADVRAIEDDPPNLAVTLNEDRISLAAGRG